MRQNNTQQNTSDQTTEAGKTAPWRTGRIIAEPPRYAFESEDVASEPSPIALVPVADIATRADWQVRDQINPALVRDYITQYVYGATMPPLRLANVGGALILIDGWHRLLAQKQLGRDAVEATVEELSEDEGEWEAAMANTRNGVRLTRQSEKRRVFELYIRQGRNRVGRLGLKSYRDIAKDLGGLASKSSIENWMKKLFPKIAAKMRSGRDDNAGASDPTKPLNTAEIRVREALAQAVAEARGVACWGKRRAIVHEFAKALLEPVKAPTGAAEAIEINNDF
jgi:ParB-like chromosome segregation protein Spo0J